MIYATGKFWIYNFDNCDFCENSVSYAVNTDSLRLKFTPYMHMQLYD